MFYAEILDKWIPKMGDCISELSGANIGAAIRKPKDFRLVLPKCLEELGRDPDLKFLGILTSGAAVGYMSELRNFPEVFHAESKLRVYDEQRQLLGNYRAVLRKEESSTKASNGDLEGGLVSGTLSLNRDLDLNTITPPLNFIWSGIEDLARPDVGTLVDAAQGGGNQHIRLTMQPVRPGIADARRILDVLENPIGSKFDGGKDRRRVIFHEGERGLVSIVCTNGMSYSNTVGAVGVGSAGGNWGRIASAAQRWSLKLVEYRVFSMLLFSYDTLFLSKSEIFDESLLVIVFFLMFLGYLFSDEML